MVEELGDSAGSVPLPAVAPRPQALSRRTALKGIGLGAVTVLVAGSGLVTVRAADNGVFDAGSGTPYELWHAWRAEPGPLGVVAAGVLAANPHNMQPWRFAVADSSVELYADPQRRMPHVDPFDRERHIGFGCALQNMVLAAQARGYVPTVQMLPDGDTDLVAHVALAGGSRPTSTLESALYGAIGQRHSNRGPYTGQPVPDAAVTGFAGLADGTSDLGLVWVREPLERRALGQLLVDAAQAVVDDEQQSLDGYAWFRDSRAAIDRHRDGLTLDCQGLSEPVLTLAKILPASSRTAGDDFWVQQTRDVHTKTAAAYGVIVAQDARDARQQLAGGMLLQRIHLAATAKGIALQHMNQITERIDREAELGKPATFAPRFAAVLGDQARAPLATFRIGYPARAARPSPRRSISAVTR